MLSQTMVKVALVEKMPLLLVKIALFVMKLSLVQILTSIVMKCCPSPLLLKIRFQMVILQ